MRVRKRIWGFHQFRAEAFGFYSKKLLSSLHTSATCFPLLFRKEVTGVLRHHLRRRSCFRRARFYFKMTQTAIVGFRPRMRVSMRWAIERESGFLGAEAVDL